MATLQDLNALSHEELLALAMDQQSKLQKAGNKGKVLKVYGKGVKRVNPQGETVIGKGNVALYGIQRMPITLYPKQWLEVLDMADEIRATIQANRDVLSWERD